MKITIDDEKRSALVFLEKKNSLRKKALLMKNDNNAKKIRHNNKRGINDNTIDFLYDKVICSLDSVSSVLEKDDCSFHINILSLLMDFAYIDLKFNDRQLTSLLLYCLRRNLSINNLVFFDKYYVNLHNIIKEYYFDKQDSEFNLNDFTNEDVGKIKLALDNVDIHKKIKPKVIKVLNDMAIQLASKKEEVTDLSEDLEKTKKRYKKKKIEQTSYINLQSLTKSLQQKSTEPMLSKKEYYRINNELLEYFSFDDKKTSLQDINNSIMLDKPLCNSERNRCVELLSQAKYDISTIKTFLEKAYSYNKYCMNPLAFYNDLYDLLRELIKNNYDEYYYLEVYIEDINKLILEMNMCNRKSYSIRLELIKNMLDEILEMLPQEKINSYYLNKIKILKK